MNKNLLAGFTGLLACCAVNPLVIADDPITIVVTASRGAETVDETLVPVTIINRQKIEQSGAVSVAEVLATVPGINLSNNGGLGQQTSLFLRGTESDHVLVLIDGVKVGSATSGTAPFQNLPLSQVEKIEVVRGPRSSLYGSEALGGVIQIFTRKGTTGHKANIRAAAGSHNTSDIEAGISGGAAKGWYSVNASNFNTDGFDACRGDINAGCFADEPDDDGYENTSVLLRGGATLSDKVNVEAGLLISDSESEFDGSFQNQSESLTRTAHIKASINATDNWSSSLLLAQSVDQSDNFLDGTFASRFDTERDQISWQNDILLGASKIIVGVEHISDTVDSDMPFTVSSRDNTGLFTSFNTQTSVADMELSLRSDDNEQFGTETTGGIAFGYDVNENTRATISYGTAFKAPTFNELYFPDFGNPDLTAETSQSFDIGLAGKTTSGGWSVNIFQTEIDDLIGFDPVTFAPVNINEAEITGIELVGNYLIASWDFSANLTLQDPKDASGGVDDGNQLARRAKQIVQLSADRHIGNASVGFSLLSRGKTFDDPANETQLDSFSVLNLHGEMRVSSNWVFGIQINNVLDETYETAAFYNQDGVNALATLRYNPR